MGGRNCGAVTVSGGANSSQRPLPDRGVPPSCAQHRALAGSFHFLDALIAHGVEQRIGAAMLRNDQRSVDFDERHERERTLGRGADAARSDRLRRCD